MFKLGRVAPPYRVWTDRTISGEWELMPTSDSEVWVAMVDHEGQIGMCQNWTGIIEVRGDTEDMAVFMAEQIIQKLNDPKTQFKQKLTIGE